MQYVAYGKQNFGKNVVIVFDGYPQLRRIISK